MLSYARFIKAANLGGANPRGSAMKAIALMAAIAMAAAAATPAAAAAKKAKKPAAVAAKATDTNEQSWRLVRDAFPIVLPSWAIPIYLHANPAAKKM